MNREEIQKYKKYFNNKSVLLVDDDKDIVELMETILEMFFSKVFYAHDGVEGVACYKKYKPDFVLSDVTMPKCDGLAMAQLLKEFDENLKIAFLTGHSEEEYINSINLYGGFKIIKPINQEKLFDEIKKLLS